MSLTITQIYDIEYLGYAANTPFGIWWRISWVVLLTIPFG